MEFRTKLDFSTRQVKQNAETFSVLSGGTVFGLPFSSLSTGPNLNTTITALTETGLLSTFSGNSSVTVYTWYDNVMNLANSTLSAITPSNSATTQNAGPSYTSSTTTVIDGNSVTLTYSGVSFDITPVSMYNLGSGNYSGTVYTEILNILSAGTLDYTGRTIWVDVSGITRTNKLIITSVGAGPAVTDIGVDAQGFVVDQASDINLKENISEISNALDKVKALRGVTYNWRDRDKGGDAVKFGFIAQEVNSVVPELTYYGSNSDYMGVHYKDITALLVEAIKELAKNSGPTIEASTEISTVNLQTQTVVAEDNNIELNYNGSRETAVGGGFIVLHALGENKNVEFITDTDGNWVTNTGLKPNSLTIPFYTPASSTDANGNEGDLVRDDDYMYIKTSNGWKRTKLEEF